MMPNHTLLDDIDPLAGLDCQRNILLDEENRHPFAVEHIDDVAEDRLQGRALADAVAPEQAHYLASPDFERDAVQDMALAVIGVNLLDPNEGLRAHRSLRS